ncbi:hypothetical protein Clacol_004680 [Clathrus columnatus]|uniref:Uncharacterized protein n=1 Tax=Clathrus columnatus TaxID=1419009 RepID=A0AAV5A755_9AGAM|nr:hypothetical protein Clacol_004680 [Clathrus columnatus]
MRPTTVRFPIISDPSFNLLCSSYLAILILAANVVVILSDVLAFLAVIRQVWGLWKEKRRLGLYTGKDCVTLLLQQGVLRFSFVLFVTTAGADVDAFQNVLSTILICEFTLDLRRRNTTRSLPNLSASELPDLNLTSQNNSVKSIQFVLLGRLQERIIADMIRKGVI